MNKRNAKVFKRSAKIKFFIYEGFFCLCLDSDPDLEMAYSRNKQTNLIIMHDPRREEWKGLQHIFKLKNNNIEFIIIA